MVWLLPQMHLHGITSNDLGQCGFHFVAQKQIWSLMTCSTTKSADALVSLQLLISEVQRLVQRGNANQYVASRVQNLVYEIEGQLHLPLTVSEMAKRCFISEEPLNRLSKQLFNMSPRSKLIELRMHKAADLLQYRAWSIMMIANRLGYRDPYNFTHRFKKFYGISPTRYRKQLMENEKKRGQIFCFQWSFIVLAL